MRREPGRDKPGDEKSPMWPPSADIIRLVLSALSVISKIIKLLDHWQS
jgi:hypothetical protein